jgi:hypothetical protein
LQAWSEPQQEQTDAEARPGHKPTHLLGRALILRTDDLHEFGVVRQDVVPNAVTMLEC